VTVLLNYLIGHIYFTLLSRYLLVLACCNNEELLETGSITVRVRVARAALDPWLAIIFTYLSSVCPSVSGWWCIWCCNWWQAL